MKSKALLVVLLPVLSLGALLIVTNLTSPLAGGPAVILLVFILLYLFFLPIFYLLLNASLALWRLISRRHTPKARPNSRRHYYIASVLACFPLFVLALQSIGAVRPFDIGLVMVFIALAAFYIAKRA